MVRGGAGGRCAQRLAGDIRLRVRAMLSTPSCSSAIRPRFPPSADGRLDLLDVLVFLAAAFLLVWLSPSGFRVRLFSNRFVATCSFLPVLGLGMRVAGALSGHPELAAAEALVEGALMGFPAGVMLCAWGRVIGRFPIERSVPVVFIGSALGSALGFAVSVLPIEGAVLALQVLLVPSFLLMPAAGGRVGSRPHFRNEGGREDAAPAEEASGPEVPDRAPRVEMSAEASSLSMRILAGTCVYGLAAGLAESTLAAPAVAEASTDTFVLLLFALYCLCGHSAVRGLPLLSMRKILPSRDGSTPEDAGPLDGSYRLAVLLMLTGFPPRPYAQAFGIAGESVIFAGYMGVTTVLVSLFLVMGRISRCDSARAFAQGSRRCFFGEIVGVVAGSVVGAVPGMLRRLPSSRLPASRSSWLICSCSPIAILRACPTSSRRPICSRRLASASRRTPRCRSGNRRSSAGAARAHERAHRGGVLHIEEHGRHAHEAHLREMRGSR